MCRLFGLGHIGYKGEDESYESQASAYRNKYEIATRHKNCGDQKSYGYHCKDDSKNNECFHNK